MVPGDVMSSHTPLLFWVSQFHEWFDSQKKCYTIAHTHIRIYATLLNNELMNKKTTTQTFQATSEQVILN